MKIEKITSVDERKNRAILIPSVDALAQFGFTPDETIYLQRKISVKTPLASIHRNSHMVFVRLTDIEKTNDADIEKLRNDGHAICKKIEDEKWNQVEVTDLCNNPNFTLALIEGMLWGSYRFDKYKTPGDEPTVTLAQITTSSEVVSQAMLDELLAVNESVALARNLINEIPAQQTAQQLADEAKATATQYGFNCSILNKQEIEILGMGGLLAVNQGSVNPPTFTIMEWHPANAVNAQPIVLVGKGIVYDTGGINLKTMPGSLDDMKCDMSGAAAVIGTMAAISRNHLPVHVIGLIPATDNRPGFNAYVPGDVIRMHSGATVEVMNTDAEGRLILADALSFAKQYNPLLVIDLATLTGSAMMAIGSFGTVCMGTADDHIFDTLEKTGLQTGERLTRFPFWDEYDELLKSEVADMKNIGGREAGAITAGKFLARFTDYPWIHLDIAGPAFLSKPHGYRSVGGTGVGVRLLYGYLKGMINPQ
jgi:leucyl aminopeptidase